jgi:hypothetical protein
MKERIHAAAVGDVDAPAETNSTQRPDKVVTGSVAFGSRARSLEDRGIFGTPESLSGASAARRINGLPCIGFWHGACARIGRERIRKR